MAADGSTHHSQVSPGSNLRAYVACFLDPLLAQLESESGIAGWLVIGGDGLYHWFLHLKYFRWVKQLQHPDEKMPLHDLEDDVPNEDALGKLVPC